MAVTPVETEALRRNPAGRVAIMSFAASRDDWQASVEAVTRRPAVRASGLRLDALAGRGFPGIRIRHGRPPVDGGCGQTGTTDM